MTPERLAGIRESERKGSWAFALADRSDLLDEVDRQAQEIAELRVALDRYGEHESRCIRSQWSAGRPTDSGGYEMCYGGQWYEVSPKNMTPACTCGFDVAVMREVK